MALKLITPALPVVSWAEAAARLQLDETSNDRPFVEAIIAAATSRIDGYGGTLGRAIGVQTWDLVYDAFPCGPIQLPLPPLRSVTGVYYVDREGEEQTLADDRYVVDTTSPDGWVIPASGWPATMATANAMRVRFVAGYDPVPGAIKVAVTLMMQQMWAIGREDLFLRSEAVEGVGTTTYTVSEQAGALVDKVVASLLSGFRVRRI